MRFLPARHRGAGLVMSRVDVIATTGLLLIIAAVLIQTGCAQTSPRFLPPTDFTFKGRWEGSFTNTSGTRFAQAMILEEEGGGELRGRYVGLDRGNPALLGREVPGGVRGRIKLPDVVFTLSGVDFILTLISQNEMRGYTASAPGGGAAGWFEFRRKKE